METFLKLITIRLFSIANARALWSPKLFLQTLPLSHLQACLKNYHTHLNLRKHPLQKERMSVIRLREVGGKKTNRLLSWKETATKKNLLHDGPACTHGRVLYLPANPMITIQHLINCCGCHGGSGEEAFCSQRNTFQLTARKSTVLWLKPGKTPHVTTTAAFPQNTNATQNAYKTPIHMTLQLHICIWLWLPKLWNPKIQHHMRMAGNQWFCPMSAARKSLHSYHSSGPSQAHSLKNFMQELLKWKQLLQLSEHKKYNFVPQFTSMGEYVEYQFTGMNFTSSDAFLGGSVWGF